MGQVLLTQNAPTKRFCCARLCPAAAARLPINVEPQMSLTLAIFYRTAIISLFLFPPSYSNTIKTETQRKCRRHITDFIAI